MTTSAKPSAGLQNAHQFRNRKLKFGEALKMVECRSGNEEIEGIITEREHSSIRRDRIALKRRFPAGGKTKPLPEDLARGVDRIAEIASELPTAIMCSESKPLSQHKVPRANCHRVGMLAPMLRAKGIERIIHIMPDGTSIEFDESAVPSIW